MTAMCRRGCAGPARDAGPERRYVRDYIDARFNVGELMLPVSVLIRTEEQIEQESQNGQSRNGVSTEGQFSNSKTAELVDHQGDAIGRHVLKEQGIPEMSA